MTLPRIVYAAPPTLEKWLDMAKAIRLLAEQDELERKKQAKDRSSGRTIVEDAVREVCRELSKAGFYPNEPRVPAGRPDGGQWTNASGSGNANDPRVLSDAAPDNN